MKRSSLTSYCVFSFLIKLLLPGIWMTSLLKGRKTQTNKQKYHRKIIIITRYITENVPGWADNHINHAVQWLNLFHDFLYHTRLILSVFCFLTLIFWYLNVGFIWCYYYMIYIIQFENILIVIFSISNEMFCCFSVLSTPLFLYPPPPPSTTVLHAYSCLLDHKS